MLSANVLLAAALAAVPGEHPRGQGAVTYVTAQRIYLDVGSDDGLAPGAELELRRAGEVVARCKVDALSANHASCPGAHARAGDTFKYEAAPDTRPAVKTLPPPPGEQVLANRFAVMSTAPLQPVEFKATAQEQQVVRHRVADVALEHATWTGSGMGSEHREAVDVVLRGVPLASWLTLDVDARAERWTSRQSPRFRPKDDTQLYVWQAQLTGAPRPDLSFALGRILPWEIPGATVFDGGLVGWHGSGHGNVFGAGLFGGTVPDPVKLDPTSQRATGGAFWSVDRFFTGGATLRHEGRVAVVRSPELGTRGEVSLTGRFFLRQLDLSADVQLGAGGKPGTRSDAAIDAARLDASFRPRGGLSLGGSFRYSGLPYGQALEPALYPGRTQHVDAFLAYDVGPRLRLSAIGGESRDRTSKLDRQWFGPEVTLPRLIFGRGSVSAGYLLERGWLEGQSAYLQVVGRPWQPVQLLVRGSWSRTNDLGLYKDELAVYLSGQADVAEHFALRLSLAGRSGLDLGAGEGEAASNPWGLTGFASLVASY